MRDRRFRDRLVVTLAGSLCALAGMCMASTSVQAFTRHNPNPPPITKPIEENASGKFERVNAMTVDDGSLWLAGESFGGSRVERFDAATGEPESFEPPLVLPSGFEVASPLGAIAVGHSTGEEEIYVGGRSGEAAVAVFGSTGGATPKPQAVWTGISNTQDVTGIAVDETTGFATDWAKGDVYVSSLQAADKVVDVFKPEKEGKKTLVTQLAGACPNEGESLGVCSIEPFVSPEEVVVDDSSGNVYVMDEHTVDVFEPTALDEYRFVRKLQGPEGKLFPRSNLVLAVDGGKGDPQYEGNVYVTSEEKDSIVYEFTRAGTFMGEFTDAVDNVLSIAVDPVTHDVYIGGVQSSAEHNGVVDVFGPNVTIPDVETEPPSNLKLENELWNIRMIGTVNPDEAGEATCSFVWGTSAAFGNTAPCTSTIPNGASPVPVHANLTELLPDETYYYRLQAENINGKNPGSELQNQVFITPGPGLRSESVSKVTSSGAMFEATISPHDSPVAGYDLQQVTKSPTTYYFQYSTANTQACSVTPSSCTSNPIAPASLDPNQVNVDVEQSVKGLLPDTVYHYRVVTANEALPETHPGVIDEFYGQDRTFTTQPTNSPRESADGRMWELVSPVNKHGAVVFPIAEVGVVQAAAGGDAFTYLASAPTESEPQGYSGTVQVLSSRGGSGWSSQDIETSHDTPIGNFPGQGYEYRFFSDDLSSALAEPLGPFSVPEGWHEDEQHEWKHVVESSPEPMERTPYLRHDTSCGSALSSCYEPLVLGCPQVGKVCPPSVEENADVPPGTQFGGNEEAPFGAANFVGASPDASHVVLDSSVQLTKLPEASAGGLYEWSRRAPAGERLALVSQLPSGEGGKAAGNVSFGDPQGAEDVARNAISENGARVFFSAQGAGGHEHLYVRDVEKAETVRLDPIESALSPLFQVASVDGAKAFFTDQQALTAGAGATNGAPDLYVCVISEALKCNLSDLTPPPAAGQPGAGERADVQGGVLGASEDGSYVYFVADGVLAEGATAGAPNLYVAHDGAGSWETRFIATLSGDDSPDWASHLVYMTARVSPDGMWVAFMSDRSLTGYDNHDAVSGLPDEEVYLYDAGSGKLVCASCDPSGARPAGVEYRKLNDGLVGGDRVWSDGQWLAGNIPGWTPYRNATALHQSRYLSDGGRLFFNSSDALVSQDENHNEDVYEYEPPGAGACNESNPTFNGSIGGCLGLISSGLAFGESAFLDASESGGDVFFLTTERLVTRDVDTSLDVYDAHECIAASPCPRPEPVAPPECRDASACRPAPLSQPSLYGAPSSATFSGAGNVSPPPAGGSSPPKKKTKTAAQIRAEKLTKALKACRKKKKVKNGGRAACERKARTKYGPAKSSRARARG